MGGTSVYGLAGRLTVVGGVRGAPSSRGSRGGSFSEGLETAQYPDLDMWKNSFYLAVFLESLFALFEMDSLPFL